MEFVIQGSLVWFSGKVNFLHDNRSWTLTLMIICLSLQIQKLCGISIWSRAKKLVINRETSRITSLCANCQNMIKINTEFAVTRNVSIGHTYPHFSNSVTKLRILRRTSGRNGIRGNFFCNFLEGYFNRRLLVPYSIVMKWNLLFSFVLFTVRWPPITFW